MNNNNSNNKEKIFYAHKAILASRSEYFRVMFLPTVTLQNPNLLNTLTNWVGSLSLEDNKQISAVTIKDTDPLYDNHLSL
jgi:hypothetical protein